MKIMFEGKEIEIDDIDEGEQSLDYLTKSRIPGENDNFEVTREINGNDIISKENVDNDSK